MTVANTTSKAGPYVGAGVTGPFPVDFRFLENSHLEVIRTSASGAEIILTLDSDYTVSGAGSMFGAVTLVAPLPVGETLTILRDVPATQELDYVQNDAFPAESHERGLDKLTMLVQQMREILGRAMRLPASLTGVSPVMPVPVANRGLKWNSTGTAVVNGLFDIDAVGAAAAEAAASAAASAASAAGAYDAFDDRYLGSLESDPVGDNDGDQLVEGALYWNSIGNSMRVYDGLSWREVSSTVSYQIANFAGGTAGPFTLPVAPANKNNIDVYIGGVYQEKIGFDVDGSTLTFTEATPADSTIEVVLASILPVATADADNVVYLAADAGAVIRTGRAKLRENISVKDFGARGDWNGITGTDDAPAFQAAIDYVASIGGGTVYVPPVAKAYRLNAKVIVKSGVVLKGDSGRNFMNFLQATIDGYYGRHCLAITWGANTTASMAIEMRPNTGVEGLNFIYPGQVTSLLAAAPIPFPPTIAGNEGTCPGGAIVNCNFVNSYKAVFFPYGHGNLLLKGLWGAPLGDFITLNGVYNADQLVDINVSGIFYLLENPDFNFTNNAGLLSWIQKNAKAFVIGYADALRFTDCFVGNCAVGLYLGAAPAPGGSASLTQFAYGDWVGGGMEGVTIPIQVVGSATGGVNSNGFRFANVGFAPVGLFNATRALTLLLTQENTSFDDAAGERAKIQFSNCSFWGTGNWQANCGPLEGVVDATGGDVSFTGCSFKAFQSYVARCTTGYASFKFANCDFIDRRALTGNTVHFAVAAEARCRLFFAGGNDFKGYFGANLAGGSTEVYETPQRYSFDQASLPVIEPLTIPAIGKVFKCLDGGTVSFISGGYKDREITLIFQGTSTLNDGGNLKLNGQFSSTADDTITLIFDGTNWYEKSRSAN